MNLQNYSKWTARIALAFLFPALALLLALIPLHADKSIWPLSHQFGTHHQIACIEILLAWIIVGAITLLYIGRMIYLLLQRAKWIK